MMSDQIYGLLIVIISLLIFGAMFIDADLPPKTVIKAPKNHNDSRPNSPKGSAKL